MEYSKYYVLIERLGFKAVLSNNPDEIKAADKVIFQEWERLVQR
jgi:imidazoleglycerol phosphate synthase glutamine amidotransferase subunit HisH